VKFPRLPSFACIALVLGFFSLPTLALESDSEQPIRIVADEALRDERTGLTVYRGNVQMDQGTIRIEAEQVTIYRIDSEGDKIVAEGSPAHMQQQPDLDSAPMHAWGGIIEYYRTEDRIQLRDDAVLEQDGSKVRGDRIDYYIEAQQVKATADESDSTRRVEVVIPSHRLEE
jgi:lipopolysaccharide export system protein LptA